MGLKKTRMILLAGAAVVIIAGVVAWNPSQGYQQATAATDYRQMDKFAQIMDAVKRTYVEKKTDEELVDGALSGMLSSLDPHSTYMNKDMYKHMQEETSGEFGGLGIEISSAQGGIRIISPIEDTPADRAGVMAGDLIVKIDDQLAKDLALSEAVKLMRGKPGSSIVLTIFRKTETRPLEIKIIRDVIHVKSVKSGMLAPGFVWLRVTQFQEQSSKELKEQLAKLKKAAGGKFKGAVLDLRNNPGGLLNQAVEISDMFLNEGGIVSTKSRVGRNMNFKAKAGDVLDGAPLVVLINNGSASASEIVSGALQDNKRAVLMGTKSFGKGSVQRIIPLPDGTAFKLTTSLYYTPSGRSIQATGIEPDIEVPWVAIKKVTKEKGILRISERDLKGHLANGNGKKEIKKTKKKDTVSDKMQERLSKDVQLQRALDVLKAMHVVQGRS
ncbi:MAG: S41 family peptidase [Mariprofundaceae bacterium]|nr:S41 family peptidase [Mariprofundaceae bacterium]